MAKAKSPHTQRSAASEFVGQEKVVSRREDSLAGLNHSGKTPPKE